jgi:hypothetical protein
MIQVQIKLQVESDTAIGKRLSFSFREFQNEKDYDLFTVGDGLGNALCGPPDVPTYVITDCELINN